MTLQAIRACSRCGVEKARNVENFLRIARSADGLSYHCRSCHQAYRRKWLANPTAAEQARRAPASLRRKAAPLHESARSLVRSLGERVRLHGHECAPELRTWAFIRNWLERQPTCESCKVEFDLGPKNGMASDRSPSLDRFRCDEGYTLSNTALICWRCNNIKRNYVESDLRLVADWMERRRTASQDPQA